MFICSTHDYDRFLFAHFRGEKAAKAKIASFGWDRDSQYVRTLCEFNLPALRWPDDESDADQWRADWRSAFDKEPMTKAFFKRFDEALELIQKDLRKYQKLKPSDAYSHAQLLLERMLFLYFLQNRGWLNQEKGYLLDRFTRHQDRLDDFSYYRDDLEKLFWTLASPPGSKARLQGIPFLNGGLFEDDEFDPAPIRIKDNPPLRIRNRTFQHIFDNLLEAFNFTVREDTPLNQDVAVDPEMLGKVFESIVLHAEAADPDAVAPDKRKSTGSYYTPRIVVHFICREALRQYLLGRLPRKEWESRLGKILDIDATDGIDDEEKDLLKKLLPPEDADQLASAILDLKCCDPAVGSGAFPVGLLHELVNIRRVAECAANGYVDPITPGGTAWQYKAKAHVVENCLYGVDIQQQAIEICQLRLWLSLVVDYHLGVDPFLADRSTFLKAIDHISQLPNLDMNFRRGDSLHDHICGVPIRIEPGFLKGHRSLFEKTQKLGVKLHHATKSSQKKKLRVEILRCRLAFAEQLLRDELTALEVPDGRAGQHSFAETVSQAQSKAERRRQIAKEIERIKEALEKVEADRKEMEKIVSKPMASDFYPKLRQLEGADFDSPFNFAWYLDFADIMAPKEAKPVSTLDAEFAFVNELAGQKQLVKGKTQPGGFDIIVGNPPFVTARNPKKRDLWRERWKGVCHGKYLLVCPFFELSFGLLRPGGELGFIVSNAFAKREFGKPLVEKFFPTVNIQKVVDCSGLMFPGHGTPTCIVFGGSEKPDPDSPIRITAILPGGGDLHIPPEESPLWHSIAKHHDCPGHSDSRITVADRGRKDMDMGKWPWNLEVGGEATRARLQNNVARKVRNFLSDDIGFDIIFGAREIYANPSHLWRRWKTPTKHLIQFSEGDFVRDYQINPDWVLFPYDTALEAALPRQAKEQFEPWRDDLSRRPQLGGLSQVDSGLEWYEYYRFTKRGQRNGIVFPEIATHLHFCFFTPKRVLTQTAPVVSLADVLDVDSHHLLGGLLNSSASLFWLKQVCFSKRESAEGAKDTYFVFAGGKVQQLPVPDAVATALKGKVNPLASALTELSTQCWERGQALPSLAMKKLFEAKGEAYHDWNSALPGWIAAHPEIADPFASSASLREAYHRAVEIREKLRAEMIALQEEMDWMVYQAYGLIDDFRFSIGDCRLKEGEIEPLKREERPFVLWAEAEGDFDKAVSLIPDHFSADRKKLWQARLACIRDNEHIRRIEQPVYKRRWDEQWKVGNRWQCGPPAYDAEFIAAFHWWLSEKAEWWLENRKKGGPVSLDSWTAALWSDTRVRAAWQVAAETDRRLTAWKKGEEPEAPSTKAKPKESDLFGGDAAEIPTGFAKFFKKLVKDQSVPDDIPWAVPYEKIKGKVPAAVKRIRGKLNVPRERFRTTKDGAYVWAGAEKK